MELEVELKFQSSYKLFFLFPPPPSRVPRRASSQAIKVTEDFSEALTGILKQASPHRTTMDVGKSSIRYCSTTCKI